MYSTLFTKQAAWWVSESTVCYRFLGAAVQGSESGGLERSLGMPIFNKYHIVM